MNNNNILRDYFIVGFLFGLCFPVGAILLQMIIMQDISFQGILKAHQVNPLIYMIELAPMILGIFALIGGISKKKSVDAANHLKAAKLELEHSMKLQQASNEKNQSIIDQTNHISDDLFHNSKRLKSSVLEMTHIESVITKHSEQIQQKSHLVSQHAKHISNKTNHENDNVETTLTSAKEVSERIDMTFKKLEESMADFREESQNVSLLHQEVTHVTDIILMINDIASRIKLLALNASIEASRAGEHGRGFAVVATEIRTLSESTSASTEQIETIIESIKTKTLQLNSKITEVKDHLEENIQDIETASQDVIHMIHQLTLEKESSDEIRDLTHVQVKELDDMQNNVSDINDAVYQLSSLFVDCKSSIQENDDQIIELRSIR